MGSIFTKIIDGDIPCYKIAESDSCIAFLDIFPLAKGHILVVPKREEDNVFDLTDQEYNDLFLFAKKVGAALQESMSCVRVGMAVVGLDVPHAHIHLVPLESIDDIDFKKEKLKLSQDEMESIAESIRVKL